jgi:hypothetical protein
MPESRSDLEILILKTSPLEKLPSWGFPSKGDVLRHLFFWRPGASKKYYFRV